MNDNDLTLRSSDSYDNFYEFSKKNSNTVAASSNIHFPSELIGVGGSITSSGQFYRTTNYYYYNEDVIATATTKEEVMDDVINFCKNFCPLGQEGFCDKNTKETCPLGKRIKMEGRE